MITDKRYKQLMEHVGMPNSNSLLVALQMAVNEATQAERAKQEGVIKYCMAQIHNHKKIAHINKMRKAI